MKTLMYRKQFAITSFAKGLILSIFTIVLTLNIQFATTANVNDTVIGGPITTDTILTTVNSPYHVTQNINVYTNVTLLIEPGVTLKFDPLKKLQVNGALVARGTDNAPIIFTSYQANPQPGDWAGIEFTENSLPTTVDEGGNYNGGSILERCVIEYAGGTGLAVDLKGILLDHCIVRQNTQMAILATPHVNDLSWIKNSFIVDNPATAIKIDTGVVMNSVISNNTGYETDFSNGIGITCVGCMLTNNHVTNNTGQNPAVLLSGKFNASGNYIANNTNTRPGNLSEYYSGGGVRIYGAIDGVFDGNFLFRNYAYKGAGLDVYGGSSRITHNTFVRNEAIYGGAGVLIRSSASNTVFEYNTIVGNFGPIGSERMSGLETQGGTAAHYNTLFGNIPYDVYHSSTSNFDGSLNYFGTADQNLIIAHIYDFYDNSGYKEFFFSPFLTAPDPEAPSIPPLDITTQRLTDGSVELNWEPVAELMFDHSVVPENVADISGYKVYYGDNAYPPFNGTGQLGGQSPIDVGMNTSIVFTPPIPRYAAIVTYNGEGDESWYGPIVDLSIEAVWRVNLPVVVR